MRVLVTGGAGYIGSHVVRQFAEAGNHVIAYDDMSTGDEKFLPGDVRLVCASVHDTVWLAEVLRDSAIDTVVHCAGYKFAGESVFKPLTALHQNTVGTESVLWAMYDAGVKNLVFSSSAAVYGSASLPIRESFLVDPQSPYGESKALAEQMIDAARTQFGLNATSLRYFNVVGSGYPEICDLSPHNLFPVLIKRLKDGATPVMYGSDYPTWDGTAVRDYVHVDDIARAHLSAALKMAVGNVLPPAINLGSGTGYSVRQVMEAFQEVQPFHYNTVGRREGDPARIVAHTDLAQRVLNWTPRAGLADMVRSAWDAVQ